MMDFSKWTYSEKVRDHFQNPRNLLVKGEEYVPDGEGNIGSLACGDQM
jgi:nitrogen fixation NifU-like protein